ncbi:MAG TPA: ElyC/SanA/YdcF family protein [Thermoanaerobaculia bacterium]|nr:ElyC/SanA/YdcF family protein [Thermoanaerobaculia bacterium]
MIYYQKTLGAKEQEPRTAFERSWRYLDFREFITHLDNRKALIAWREQFPPGAADLAASVIAQLVYRKWISAEFIRAALGYCRSVLQDRGYLETSPLEVMEFHADVNHVMLVLGCQGHDVRDHRARAAYEALKQFPTTEFKVVFSGHHPAEPGKRDLVLVNDEARALEREFNKLLNRDPSFSARHNYARNLERQAKSTTDNIRNLLTDRFVRSGEKVRLFLVSSTFHLIRISADVEQLVEGSTEWHDRVESVVLVGAESNAVEDPIVLTAPYVKAMMYEIFADLFKRVPMRADRSDELGGRYQGAV